MTAYSLDALDPRCCAGWLLLGQEDQFPPPRLSACYVIREKTFAGTHGNGQDAPIPDARRGEVPRTASTNSGR
jgi:hypothetical protein